MICNNLNIGRSRSNTTLLLESEFEPDFRLKPSSQIREIDSLLSRIHSLLRRVKFAVPHFREFAAKPQRRRGFFGGENLAVGPKFAKFPVFSLFNRELAGSTP